MKKLLFLTVMATVSGLLAMKILIFTLFFSFSSALFAQAVCDPLNVTVENGCVRTAPEKMKTAVREDFTKEADGYLKIYNFQENLRFERKVFHGRNALVLSNARGKNVDTAFWLVTSPVPFKEPKVCRIEFGVASDLPTGDFIGCKGTCRNRIVFYDKDNRIVKECPFRYVAGKDGFSRISLLEAFPEKACSVSLELGADHPNILPGQYVAFADISVRVLDTAGMWAKKASFTSGIFPLRNPSEAGMKDTVSWKVSGNGASARFQVATAPDVNGFPGRFTEFSGSGGNTASWFVKNGSELPVFPPDAKWIRYRAELLSSDAAPAVLEKVKFAGNVDSGWKTSFDMTPPSVVRTSVSPSLDVASAVAVKTTDDSGIDWPSVQLTLDGKDVTKRIVRTSEGFSVHPEKQFGMGIHTLRVKLRDLCGNSTDASLFFFFGEPARTGIVSLRDDGMALIDGKPFFPIGIYNVTKRDFNGKSYDTAFKDLKAAGFNFAQTYATKRDASFREFMEAAGKYGFKLWIAGEGGSNDDDWARIARSLIPDRLNPAMLAWYTGDDTAGHNTPDQLKDRAELVAAIAPHLITAQADIVFGRECSNYGAFVRSTKAFLPEIYPIRENTKEEAEACVACVIRDMKQCFADIQAEKAAPRAIWPIIQYFEGWKDWKRFPLPLELRAMSYAAIVHGAHGIVWYTYGGYADNHGVNSTPERWETMCSLSRELNTLLPILQERASKQQPVVKIHEGLAKDPFGNDSISVLAKDHSGKTYVFCVNSTLSKVRAELSVPDAKIVRNLFSGNPVKVVNGSIVDDFEPYGVRVFEVERLPVSLTYCGGNAGRMKL